MFPSMRSFSLAVVTAAAFVNSAAAQQPVRQALKDPWVATSHKLLQVDYSGAAGALELQNSGDGPRDFKALAFEAPQLGTAATGVRNLIAVDGTKLWRFEDGSTEFPPALLLDAGNAPSSLKYVTTVAVTDTGSILFSGYSKPKRVFELWELTLVPGGSPLVQLRVKSTPQLIDAVFLRAEEIVAGSALAGGGLLAAAGKQALFFPKSGGYATVVTLFDSKKLDYKGHTEILSVDLLRQTDTLMLATSERKLLTTAPKPGVVTKFASIPSTSLYKCEWYKPQQLVVRSIGNAAEASSVVADGCGQVLRYDFTSPTSQNNLPADVVKYGAGFIALAIGEGNEVTCPANAACTITEGFTATIDTPAETDLLVLQFDNLCDRRVAPQTCTLGTTDDKGHLILNSLLPPAQRAILDANGVTLKLPAYLFAAGDGGRFGAVLVQADDNGSAAPAEIELDIQALLQFELGVRVDFVRPTDSVSLLNQDVAAYVPDNPDLPTVRGFEAAPVTIGVRNPMKGALRGFSAVIYGLQHDLYPPGPRASNGGLPPSTLLDYGSTPLCNLIRGWDKFIAVDKPRNYFINLAACLFADQEKLLNSVIPAGAFVSFNDRKALIAALDVTKYKLIRALNEAGPYAGSDIFKLVLTYLDAFDAKLAASAFVPSLAIYKNELDVRSQVFRFNLTTRTYPSLPVKSYHW
jgi:hypothetical protein